MKRVSETAKLTAAIETVSRSNRDPGRGPFVLYGAGCKGRETLAVLRRQGRDVVAFIDRSGVGECEGVPIYAAASPEVGRLGRQGCTAIVTVFNPGADPLPIHETLAAAGFRRIVGMVEARQLGLANDAYWIGAVDAMTPPAAEAEWLFNALADDQSRQACTEAIALRRTGDVRWLRSPSPSDQYMPAGVPLSRTAVRFVDGGAFDGDTIVQLRSGGFQIAALAAFEPDPANYELLVRRARAAVPTAEATLWPCGLDATSRQVRFQANGLASSGIAERGELMIQTVAFDAALPNWKPTYVKLDIEGAEEDALRGMANTLHEARPAVAVCVYHKPADLWQLPRLVSEFLPNADFFLRSHAWNGFELVLYAIPREMARTR